MAIIPGGKMNEPSFVVNKQVKQQKQIYILILTLLTIAVVIYFGYWRGNSVAPPNNAFLDDNSVVKSPEQTADEITKMIKNIDLNNPVFSDKKFKELQANKNLPIKIEAKGRENPFAPF